MASCNCASALKQRRNKQDKDVQQALHFYETDGVDTLLKKEIAEDKIKLSMSKTILFLLDVIKNTDNSTKEEALILKKETVAHNPGIKPDTEGKESLAGVKGKNEEIPKSKVENSKATKMLKSKEKISICFAFKFNKCPYKKEEDCQNRHPEKCQKFCDFGHIAFDEKGCDTKKCNLLHPKLCRNSTKMKECPYKHCRFQHLQGTKYIPKKEYQNASFVMETKQQNILINKLEKVIELFANIIQNQEEGKQIQVF